jgi:hypothetical protein
MTGTTITDLVLVGVALAVLYGVVVGLFWIDGRFGR